MRRNKLLYVLLFGVLYILPPLVSGQVDTAWVRRYNAGNQADDAKAIAIDNAGNIYVTGASCATGVNFDYATIKYNSAGTQQWVQRYNGLGNSDDAAVAIIVDIAGNIYITGYSYGSGTNYDYATIKYNSAGVQQWVQRYNGLGNGTDRATAIAVDNQKNVFVTGYSMGSGTSEDFATIKYDSMGVQQWVQRYGSTSNDEALAMAIDNTGNIYVTGYITGTNVDCATIKYNSSGDTLWVRRYNGVNNFDDLGHAIAVDNQLNVYVGGYCQSSSGSNSRDCLTVKYNSVGTQQWVQLYNGTGNGQDYGYAIALDSLANVYITGYSAGSGTGSDYLTIKYNSNGVQQWAQSYNGTGNGSDYGLAIAVNRMGNVCVTGYSSGSGTSFDFATVKYNSAGVQQWVQRYNGPANNNDYGYSVAIDTQDIVYVTGHSIGSGTLSDYTTIKYVPVQGIEEYENWKLKSENCKIFPNPAKTYLNISSSLITFPFSLKLYDITGKQVKSEELKAKNCRVSLNGIKNGIYFVRVNDQMVKEKLVVTR